MVFRRSDDELSENARSKYSSWGRRKLIYGEN